MTPFRQRRPNFWIPQRKPGPPHRVEFDPQGRLSNGLSSLLLFDNSLPNLEAVFTAASMGMKDYASPETTFNTNSNANIVTTCPFGGLAFHTPGTSTTDWINYVPLNNTTTAVWTASSLLKFDGVGGGTYTGQVTWLANDGQTQGIALASGPSLFTDYSSSGFLTPAVTTLTGWQRMTIVSTGSALNLYLNGVFQSTAALTTSFALGVVLSGWPWPTADFFYWTAALTASQVAQHYADPYGTTMRPRWSPLGIVGKVAAIGRRPSLLNLGVGP
jgi:hypothetical protein